MNKRIVKKIAKDLSISVEEADDLLACNGISGAIAIAGGCEAEFLIIYTTDNIKSWRVEKRDNKILVTKDKSLSAESGEALDKILFNWDTTYEPKHEL
jgi:hypothetical protein